MFAVLVKITANLKTIVDGLKITEAYIIVILVLTLENISSQTISWKIYTNTLSTYLLIKVNFISKID